MKYPNIETERKANGYKRGEVAAALGIKRDTYNAWIYGRYPIPANFLKALCGMFRCSADYLLAPDERGARWKEYRCVGEIEKGLPQCRNADYYSVMYAETKSMLTVTVYNTSPEPLMF